MIRGRLRQHLQWRGEAHSSAFRSLTFATTCLTLGISQRFTQPYRPQTNGKAERGSAPS
jgi:transposase InsO family protein